MLYKTLMANRHAMQDIGCQVTSDTDIQLLRYITLYRNPANRKRYRDVSVWLQKRFVEPNIVESLL